MKTLAELKPGETALVVRIDEGCQGFERFRLLDLGVVPGTNISIALNNPLNDPLAYNIRGATIALRKNQSRKILIEINPNNHNGRGTNHS